MPDQVESQRAVYDEHYPQMAAAVRDQLRHPLLSSFYDRLAGLILDALPAGGTDGPRRLLEAGCGEGLLASAFRRVAGVRGIDLAYTGTDLSTAGIELARSGVDETFVAGDAVEVLAGMEAGSQDLVAAKNLLHHIENPVDFLREAKRVVGPRGRVVIVEPRMWCPMHWINLMWFRQERLAFRGYRRTARAFATAECEIVGTTEFAWLPYELALATRFNTPRRLLSVRPGPGLARITALDEWLTTRLPNLALYMVTVVRGS